MAVSWPPLAVRESLQKGASFDGHPRRIGLAGESLAEDHRPLYAPQLFVYGRSTCCLLLVRLRICVTLPRGRLSALSRYLARWLMSLGRSVAWVCGELTSCASRGLD